MTKQAPALPPGHPPLFPGRHPARVAVERCRSAAWERRRGRPAARDARWADGAQPSPPRGRWQARAPPRGPGVADGVGRRQDAGCLRGPALVQPCGLPQLYTAGWGASARQVAAAQPPVGQEDLPRSASQHRQLRPRLTRLVRRPLCFAKTDHLHDLIMGLCSNRSEFGRPLEGKINTCETPSDPSARHGDLAAYPRLTLYSTAAPFSPSREGPSACGTRSMLDIRFICEHSDLVQGGASRYLLAA